MKIAAGKADGFAARPDARVRAVLVYGPDSGLVRERLKLLTASVIDDPDDPFRLATMTAGQLKDDPARLADEAAAMSLTGGRRVVRIADATDTLTPLFKQFLAHAPGDALVLVEGGDLAARSSLRKLFESEDRAAALPCYADEGVALEGVIVQTLKRRGVAVSADALAFLTERLGGDRALTRSELDKLATYMNDGGTVDLEDARACIGDTASLSLDDLAFATAGGDRPTAQRILDREFQEGTSPVAVLRALSRHFLRLHYAAGIIAAGQGVDDAMRALRPPVFFKKAPVFKTQLRAWSPERLGQALDLLTAAEIDAKSTGLPDRSICSRLVLQLAKVSGPRRGR